MITGNLKDKYSELRCGSIDKVYHVVRSGEKTMIIQGFEAGVVEALIDSLSTAEKISLLNISQLDIEAYFIEKTASLKNYCLKALKINWFCRETDEKMKATLHEIPGLQYRTISRLRQECKKGKLSILEMEVIVDHFCSDTSDWYNKNNE